MTTIKFTGWKPGARKIRFTMLLHEEGGLSLRESKNIKDKVIGGGEAVEVTFDDPSAAKIIHEKALSLGVTNELVSEELESQSHSNKK